MDTIVRRLAAEGLRIAAPGESGWSWVGYDDDDRQVRLWVTDVTNECGSEAADDEPCAP